MSCSSSSPGGGATVSGIILNWRNRKREDRAVEAKVGLDDATKAKIVQDAAHSIEQDYLNRLADFRKEIERLNGELNNECERASEWRDRVTLLEDSSSLNTLPWDRKMTLVAREHDWVIDDPPSIMAYLRKIQAADKSDAGEP